MILRDIIQKEGGMTILEMLHDSHIELALELFQNCQFSTWQNHLGIGLSF
jgi:hypothetical protein